MTVDHGRLGVWTALDGLSATDAVAFAERVEALGYGALFVPETIGRDPFTLLGHLAARTSRLVLGTGIASIFLRHPQAAYSAATALAEMSGGRFVLGLGVSHAPMVEGLLGQEYRRPRQRMADFLDAYQQCRYMAPAPAEPAPVYVAALRGRMIALAGEKADGIFPYLVPPEHVARARDLLPTGKGIIVTQPVALTDDPAAARETARAYLRVYLGLPNYLNNLRELGFADGDLSPPGSDRLCDALVAWGSVDAVRGRIAEMHEAGADHVAVIPLLDNGFMPQQETVEALAP